jgi:hypothetical protein
MATDFPGFEIREKRVWWWWLAYYLGLMFLWNKGFMETMWTTVGRKVYIPRAESFGAEDTTGEATMGDYATLWHERQHMLDLQDLPVPGLLRAPLWFAGYFAPQILAAGTLGALWTPWAWSCLVFLAPWPSPFREWVELRGYRASAEAWMKMTGWVPDVEAPWVQRIIDDNFVGWKYYRMSWGRDRVERWFRRELAVLATGHKLERSMR